MSEDRRPAPGLQIRRDAATGGVAARLLALTFCIASLQSCAPGTEPTQRGTGVPVHPVGFPDQFYRLRALQGQPVYTIIPERSLATVNVYRGGTVAGLGHSHVIASHDVHGYFIRPAQDSGRAGATADLFIPLKTLSVDEPALRKQVGLGGPVSKEEIASTRATMLNRVLEADRYPFMRVRVTGVESTANEHARVTAELSMHGITTPFSVPVTFHATRGGLSVDGNFILAQTDFGIQPLRLFGGRLTVNDTMKLTFHLLAKPYQ